MTECYICLEETTNTNGERYYKCDHIFHKECIKKLSKFKFDCCPACKQEIDHIYDKNIIFNNMTRDRVFNLNNYLKKWKKKECIDNKHIFEMETLGDWVANKNSNEIIEFNYKYMYIKCRTCNIDKIIK
tara:strand:+ start:424 stop:810 length:387 start_codon:yes stop_codon:yes gene_type:complete